MRADILIVPAAETYGTDEGSSGAGKGSVGSFHGAVAAGAPVVFTSMRRRPPSESNLAGLVQKRRRQED